jgi:magnesium transporter
VYTPEAPDAAARPTTARGRGRRRALLRLSELQRWPVCDDRGVRTRWIDLSIDLSVRDYPPIRCLLIAGPDGTPAALPWPETSLQERTIRIPAIGDARPLDDEELAQLVLLRRDLLDALLLDMAGQRAVRANDVWLRYDATGLVVAGIDVSPWAVLRRLSRGLLGHGAERRILDWRDVEFLRGDPQAAAAGRDYHRVTATLQPAQIAALIDSIAYPEAAELLLLLPDQVAARVMEGVSLDLQVQITTELEPQQAAKIIAGMSNDTAVDLLGALAVNDATRLLEALPPEHSVALQDLLRYPPDTAGGIMTNEVVTAPAGGTVAEVNAYIKDQLRDPSFVYFVYLLDGEDSRRLRGVVTLRDLHVADEAAPIEQVMNADLLTAGPLEPALEVAHRIADNGLNAIPVVGAEQRLLGIVMIDAAMRLILPEAWRDRLPRVFS